MIKLEKSLQIWLGILSFIFTVGLVDPAVFVYADITDKMSATIIVDS